MVLRGENFRRGHEGTLMSGTHRGKERHRGNDGFAATHITL